MATARTLVSAALPLALTFPGFGSVDFGSAAPPPALPVIGYVGSVGVPTGERYAGEVIGGLSGIDYDAARDRYVAISDDRGEQGPVRLFTLTLPIRDGALSAPVFDGVTVLRDVDGNPYVPGSADTESVRWNPGTDGYLYTSEGADRAGVGGFIRQASGDGRVVRDLPLPDAYRSVLGENGAIVSGIRDNLGFEAMTVAPDGSDVSAMTENALAQDGPPANPQGPTSAKLLKLDRASGAYLGEWEYPADAVPPGAVPEATGVSEILAVDGHTYLVLERTMIPGRGFTGKLYLASADGPAGRMDKQRVFDFADVLPDSDCVEGITWGPTLPDGSRSLVVVTDDNFGRAGRTTFHLLAVGPAD
ncbi:esterase-like activity of phytase family protein [Rhodococcus sp. NPDC057014]|uniref:esterase-like activity of phytase family protein n=1 Tax=Rhodococcus sp. NPDC057014 TaxID=3346000 RepID=UPI00364252C8